MKILYYIYTQFFKIFGNKEYESLAPISNIKNNSSLDKLITDIRNEKNFNIALSGKYGAGKSSIINSLFTGIRKLIYKPLYISLGMLGLKEIDEKIDINNFCQEIEKSIIQQIIYKENSQKVPDSNIKRVSKVSKRNIFIVFLIVVLVFGVRYITSYLNLDITEWAKSKIEEIFLLRLRYKILIGIVMILALLYLSKKIARFLKKMDIKNIKFTFLNTEIQSEKSSSESLINKYMDELVYFFSATKYNVVVIEDLDRFLEIQGIKERILIIFQKLKELNQILNSSEQVKKRVVFIYVVKDSLFDDEKERTKFFDAIVPVIPVISNYNSYAELKDILKNEPIDDKLLQDISPYLNDYRVIKNIKSEYILYKKEIAGKEIIKEKQLAMITLKNLRPKKYDELLNNEGEIFEVIKSKDSIIQKRQEILQNKIKDNNIKINDIKKEPLNSLDELKKVVIGSLLSKSNTGKIISGAITYSQFLDCSFDLEKIENTNIIIKNSNGYAFNEKEIFEIFGGKNNFINRAKIFQEGANNKIKNILQDNAKLNRQIEKLYKKPFYELIEEADINFLEDKFVEMLIKNGYIDENYQDYMFRYKETIEISKNDYTFISNIRQYRNLNFDYPIANVKKVIGELNENYFGIESILNYQILDELLTSNIEEFIVKKERFINMLLKINENTQKFILGFIEYSDNVNKLYSELYKNDEKFLYKILLYNTDNEIIKDIFIKNVLKYPEILNDYESNQYIKDYIDNKFDFDIWIELNENIKLSLCKLKVKFRNLNFECSQEVCEFIYENDLYYINSTMLQLMFKYKGIDNETFNTKNLSTLFVNPDLDKMRQYIINNKQAYINNCYLEKSNDKNDINDIIYCINNWDISKESKIEIIEKMVEKLEDITQINSDYYNDIVKNDKMKPSWENYFYVYCVNNEEITDNLIKNIEINILDIPKFNNLIFGTEEKTKLDNFKEKILKNNEINEKAYVILLNKINVKINEIAINEIDENRLEILLNNKMIKFSKKNFMVIVTQKINNVDKFINDNIDEFIINLEELDLNENIVQKILESSLIPNRKKSQIVGIINIELINTDSMKYIVSNYSQNKISKISIELKNKIFMSDLKIEYKLELFEKELDKNNSKEVILNYISLLPYPYCLFGNNKEKQFTINKSETNIRIINKLINRGINITATQRKFKMIIYNIKN